MTKRWGKLDRVLQSQRPPGSPRIAEKDGRVFLVCGNEGCRFRLAERKNGKTFLHLEEGLLTVNKHWDRRFKKPLPACFVWIREVNELWWSGSSDLWGWQRRGRDFVHLIKECRVKPGPWEEDELRIIPPIRCPTCGFRTLLV